MSLSTPPSHGCGIWIVVHSEFLFTFFPSYVKVLITSVAFMIMSRLQVKLEDTVWT